MSIQRFNDPAYWDEAAAAYAEMSEPFTDAFAQDAVAALDVRPGMHVLDVACGTGAAAAAASRAGARVLATDFSSGMIARTQARALPNVETRVMNGQALDLPDAVFDAAVSVFGVMLFPDWRAGLREMARVTRPGGRVGLAVWRDPEGAATTLLLAEIRRTLWPDLPAPAGAEGMAVMSDPARLKAELEAAGCADVSIAEAAHDFRLRIGSLDKAEELFGVMPSWTAMTPEQRQEALGEIRRRAARDMVDGVWPIPSVALIATGRRI